MTEVPDKQTEGTGTRGRGRGRGRVRTGDAEPVAARGRTTSRSSAVPAPVASSSGNGSLVVLPGEKLARVVASPGAEDQDDEEPTTLEPDTETAGPVEGQESEEAGRRRRRRRGGRGRGRGRGRDGEALPAGTADQPVDAAGEADEDEDVDEADEIVASPAARGPRPTPFGSVWDSQLGVPSRQAPAAVGPGPISDDEDFEEPEIPEYLIAEQRRGRQPQGRGGPGARGGARGGRSAYTAAMERERYGRGSGGGINRYPDVSGRDRDRDRPIERQPSRGGGRPDAGYGRQDRTDRPAPRSGDPWTEVPPELEEMLRAQLAQSPKARRPETVAPAVTPAAETVAEETVPTRRRSTTRRTAESSAAAGSSEATTGEEPAAEAAAPKRRTTTRKKAEPAASAASAETGGPAPAAPKRRTTTRKKADGAEPAASGDAGSEAAPKRRTTRKKADPA